MCEKSVSSYAIAVRDISRADIVERLSRPVKTFVFRDSARVVCRVFCPLLFTCLSLHLDPFDERSIDSPSRSTLLYLGVSWNGTDCYQVLGYQLELASWWGDVWLV